jgi:hypothetical protein
VGCYESDKTPSVRVLSSQIAPFRIVQIVGAMSLEFQPEDLRLPFLQCEPEV